MSVTSLVDSPRRRPPRRGGRRGVQHAIPGSAQAGLRRLRHRLAVPRHEVRGHDCLLGRWEGAAELPGRTSPSRGTAACLGAYPHPPSRGQTWQRDWWGAMSRAGPWKPNNVNEAGSALALHLFFSFRPCSIHALPFSLRPVAGPWGSCPARCQQRHQEGCHGPGVLQTKGQAAGRRAAPTCGPSLGDWEKGRCCRSGPLWRALAGSRDSFPRRKKHVAVKVLKSREGFAEAAQDEVALLRCVCILWGSVLCSAGTATGFRSEYQPRHPSSLQVSA